MIRDILIQSQTAEAGDPGAESFQALEIGTIDAIINDYATNAYISDQRGNTKVAQLIKTNENYGIGIRKGDAQMVAGVNKALAAMLNDGSYKAIYQKWFGAPNAK